MMKIKYIFQPQFISLVALFRLQFGQVGWLEDSPGSKQDTELRPNPTWPTQVGRELTRLKSEATQIWLGRVRWVDSKLFYIYI